VDTPTLGAVSDAANSVTVTDADCPASPPLCVVEAYDNDITPVPAGDNQDEARTSLGTNTMTGPGPTVVVVPGNIVQNHPITVTVTLPTGDTSAISGKVVAGP